MIKCSGEIGGCKEGCWIFIKPRCRGYLPNTLWAHREKRVCKRLSRMTPATT